MKRVYITLAILVHLVLQACHSEENIPTFPTSFTTHIYSRSIVENNIPQGSTALFHLSGGVSTDNEIFTLVGNHWTNNSIIEWPDNNETTYVTAFHPAYESRKYTIENLYTTGELEDILYAQDTLYNQREVQLEFKHLFSLLTIQIDESLQENLQEVQVTIPLKVSEINTSTATFSTIEESQTIIRSSINTGSYQFIIPSVANCSLQLTLIMNNGSIYEHNLLPYTFRSNFRYECNILDNQSKPGIRTAEDLIAFCKLINENSYDGEKTLSDFGEEIDGRTIYYLLADIQLTEEENSQLVPIKYKSNKRFTDMFDGKDHTISNFSLPVSNGSAGLFGTVDTIGVIKNLHITNCTDNDFSSGTSKGLGFIVSCCYGTISNCSVSNSSAANHYNSYTGGICGVLKSGTIINCQVNNTNLTATSSNVGGIVGYAQSGKILNCYSSQNTIQNQTGCTNGRGGLIGYAYKSTISNSYVHNLKFDSRKTNKGLIVATANNLTISHCLYDNQSITLVYDGTYSQSGNEYYSSNFITATHQLPVYEQLNSWIMDTGSTLYPNYEFYKWKEDDNFPAIYQ